MVGHQTNPSAARLPAWKKAVFALLAVGAFFVLLELVLLASGVEPSPYASDPYVGFAANLPLFEEVENDGGGVELRTASGKLAWFNPQRFSKPKRAGTYRIFCLGGSTTYGRPYTDGASFSGWLRELLPAADSTRQWEVINCGGISYASYRVALLMEELLDYEPDLFIIYSGHNEFLERRTYERLIETPRAVTALGGLVSRTRTHALLTRLLSGPPPSAPSGAAGTPQLGGEVDTLLEHSIGPSEYTRSDEQRERIVAHFRFNLHRMISMARSVGAGVVLVTPAANLRDCSPLKSEPSPGLSPDQLERFNEQVRRGQEAWSAGDAARALVEYDAAHAIDARRADLHYRRGLALFALKRYEEARAAFARALEEDVCPLRAPRSIRDAVVTAATEERVALVDFARHVEERAEHGIPGAETFHDHVHLRVEGYRRLALELMDRLAADGILTKRSSWDERTIQAATQRVESRIDKRAEGVALRNLAKVFSWAGKLDEAARMAQQAKELLGDDAESHLVLGRSAEGRGDLATAIAEYRRVLELHPRYADAHLNLGRALRLSGEIEEAIKHYEEALRIKPDLLDARFNLGLALRLKGDPRQAVVQLRQVVERRPEDAAAHYHLAEALGVLDREPEAIEHYNQAILHNPRYAEPHCNLGVLLHEQGRLDEAEKHLREAIEIKPRFAEAHHNLAVLLHTRGRPEDAERHYRKALEADPDHAEAAYNLAVLLHTTRRLKEAAALYGRVIDITPDNADAHYNLGLILHAHGRRSAAIHHYREALRHQPGHEKAKRRLAIAEREK